MVLDKSGLGIDTTRDWKQNALLVADSGVAIGGKKLAFDMPANGWATLRIKP